MSKKKSKEKNNDFLSTAYINEEGYQRFGNETVTYENVADAARDYSCLFGANKNLFRISPSLQDGLKPGKRRLFWSWWELEGKPSNIKPETLSRLKQRKVDTIASVAMSYHPHGSTANESIIGREGQYWNNNVMCIEPHGSYGNLESSDPAAGRYITAKLSEYVIDCFFDNFNNYCVPMKLAYDGEKYEPEFLIKDSLSSN